MQFNLDRHWVTTGCSPIRSADPTGRIERSHRRPRYFQSNQATSWRGCRKPSAARRTARPARPSRPRMADAAAHRRRDSVGRADGLGRFRPADTLCSAPVLSWTGTTLSTLMLRREDDWWCVTAEMTTQLGLRRSLQSKTTTSRSTRTRRRFGPPRACPLVSMTSVGTTSRRSGDG